MTAPIACAGPRRATSRTPSATPCLACASRARGRASRAAPSACRSARAGQDRPPPRRPARPTQCSDASPRGPARRCGADRHGSSHWTICSAMRRPTRSLRRGRSAARDGRDLLPEMACSRREHRQPHGAAASAAWATRQLTLCRDGSRSSREYQSRTPSSCRREIASRSHRDRIPAPSPRATSAASRLHLGGISAASRLHLGGISAGARVQGGSVLQRAPRSEFAEIVGLG